MAAYNVSSLLYLLIYPFTSCSGITESQRHVPCCVLVHLPGPGVNTPCTRPFMNGRNDNKSVIYGLQIDYLENLYVVTKCHRFFVTAKQDCCCSLSNKTKKFSLQLTGVYTLFSYKLHLNNYRYSYITLIGTAPLYLPQVSLADQIDF